MEKFPEIEPLNLPSLPLSEKHNLPNLPAIYFAISDSNEIIYIGRTGKLATRWISHHRYYKLKAMGNIRIAWFQCSEESLLPQIEEVLISHFQPPLNGKRNSEQKLENKLDLNKGFSLGKNFRATRELLGMTQEQVIEQLETRYGVILSQQALSYIENGKRKIDSERELPALAGVYGKPVSYFYKDLQLPTTPPSAPAPKRKSVVTIDLEALTERDKLELAAELIHNVLQET